MNILCISIDGLHNGMIGCYGNTWIRTPALDALACRSVLFDRYYTDSLRIDEIFDSLWCSSPLTALRSILLTDDDDVFHHAAAAFDEKHRLELPDRVAEDVDETQFFKAFATIVDLLDNGPGKEKPFFLWAHLQGFRGVWDFPAEYRERFRDEEDPLPYAEIAPPKVPLEGGAEPEEVIDPDELQAVMEAYSGGVSALDDALAGLFDWFEENADDTLLVFLSTRGFSLGEHGRIGANEMLYGENLQLPLFVRFPGNSFPEAAALRCNTLLKPSDLGDFLAAAAVSDPTADAGQWLDFKSRILDGEPIRDSLSIGNSTADRALLNSEWFLRQSDDRFELYVKPDDRWEVNDVADRCPEVVEELTGTQKT